ncbi:MAG: hypothetical protein P1V97_01765 [Planctomycetota bacterium]|nr:hypothetical protein [Planctomycetota bacterium]
MNDSIVLCKKHVDRETTTSCERCGDFICNECVQDLFNRQVCLNCHKNYGGKLLSDFQASLWGKRDGYVWMIGGIGSLMFFSQIVLWSVLAFQVIFDGNGLSGELWEMFILVLFSGLALGITGAYFLLKNWARKALFLFPLTGFVLALASFSDTPNAIGLSFVFVLLPLVFVISAYTNPQNKLAFRIEVSTEELETLFETTKSNSAAHNAFALSLLAFFLPPLLFLSLYLALRGRKNCDPEAWPPVGGMKPAQNALILTTLGFLLWTVILIFSARP